MEIPVKLRLPVQPACGSWRMLSLAAIWLPAQAFTGQRNLVGAGLDSPRQAVFSTGRVTIEVRDENGYTMPGLHRWTSVGRSRGSSRPAPSRTATGG